VAIVPKLSIDLAWDEGGRSWVVIQTLAGRSAGHVQRWRAPDGVPEGGVLDDLVGVVADAVGSAVEIFGAQLRHPRADGLAQRAADEARASSS
jgi:hypothetical protein